MHLLFKYLFFNPGSWHRASNPWNFWWVSFVWMRRPLVGFCIASGWGLVIKKTKPWWEAWNFMSTPYSAGRMERMKTDYIVSMEILNCVVLPSWTDPHARRVVHSNFLVMEAPTLKPFQIQCIISLYLTVNLSFIISFMISWKMQANVFMSFVNPSQQMIKPGRVLWDSLAL